MRRVTFAGAMRAGLAWLQLFCFCTVTMTPVLAGSPDPRQIDIPVRNWPVPQYWMPAQPPTSTTDITTGLKAASDAPVATPRMGSVTPLSGPLVFVAITPCRMVDTRAFAGMPAPFGVPALGAYSTRNFPLKNHPTCVIPPEAKAYSLNIVAIPQGPLSFLSAWPGGYPFPVTSFLNSYTGDIVNNAVIIAAGVNGSINVVAGNPTDLLIDVNGYFVDMPEAKRALGGVVSANGSSQSLPAGCSSARNGVGQYTITFPAGTFPAGSSPAPVLSPIGSPATLQGASIVRLNDGSGTMTVNWSNDVTFSFVVAPN